MIDTKEQEAKELEQKKEEEKGNWWTRVPVLYKVGGALIIFFKYLSVTKTPGGNLNELWVWIIAVVLVWWYLGQEGQRRQAHILTPEEAETALKKELVRKVKEGQISRWAKIYLGPNNGLFHHEGLPIHYQIQIELVEDYLREYKRAVVFADGPEKGYVTIQDVPAKLTGREVIPVKTPKIFKMLKKFDVDVDQFIFGPKRKQEVP